MVVKNRLQAIAAASRKRYGNLTSPTPMTRRSFLTRMGAGTATLSLGLPIRQAFAESEVNFLGWQGYDDAFMAGGFMEDNDIRFETTYISTTEDILTRLRAGGKGTYDLVTLNHMYVSLSAQADLLEPIKRGRIPNLDKMLTRLRQPAELGLDDIEVNGELYGVPFTFSSCALLYNPDMVSEPPTSWMNFLKPEYKGRVAMFSDAMTNVLVWARAGLGIETPTRMTREELEETIDFMIEIKTKHARAMPSSLGEGADMLARGEVAMIMGWEPMVIWNAAAGRRPEIAKPEEGTWGFFDTINIPARAPNYELDHDLINHCLSKEAQAVFGNQHALGIVNRESIDLLEPEVRALYNYDNLDAYFSQAHLYPMFPMESDGKHVTFDEMLQEYERFLSA
ncbi:MAG: extracellular solute-binding protein [Gammaproteobacteria bacterium]|nr:extracellular solute-binding protein [Gammaproteobacteria bacterium]